MLAGVTWSLSPIWEQIFSEGKKYKATSQRDSALCHPYLASQIGWSWVCNSGSSAAAFLNKVRHILARPAQSQAVFRNPRPEMALHWVKQTQSFPSQPRPNKGNTKRKLSEALLKLASNWVKGPLLCTFTPTTNSSLGGKIGEAVPSPWTSQGISDPSWFPHLVYLLLSTSTVDLEIKWFPQVPREAIFHQRAGASHKSHSAFHSVSLMSMNVLRATAQCVVALYDLCCLGRSVHHMGHRVRNKSNTSPALCTYSLFAGNSPRQLKH